MKRLVHPAWLQVTVFVQGRWLRRGRGAGPHSKQPPAHWPWGWCGQRQRGQWTMTSPDVSSVHFRSFTSSTHSGFGLIAPEIAWREKLFSFTPGGTCGRQSSLGSMPEASFWMPSGPGAGGGGTGTDHWALPAAAPLGHLVMAGTSGSGDLQEQEMLHPTPPPRALSTHEPSPGSVLDGSAQDGLARAWLPLVPSGTEEPMSWGPSLSPNAAGGFGRGNTAMAELSEILQTLSPAPTQSTSE